MPALLYYRQSVRQLRSHFPGTRRPNLLRRVINLHVQGLGQVTFTVHEDEIKRFHLEFHLSCDEH